MSGRWLDAARFPGRAFLAAIARDHRAIGGSVDGRAAAAEALQSRWAERLGAQADDLLLFASAEEAAGLACGALLAPGDVALLARPCAALWPAAALASGAAFVDVGRLADGRLDPAGVAYAAATHPAGVWLLDAPSLAGQDDVALWSEAMATGAPTSQPCAIALVDMRDAPGHGAAAGAALAVPARDLGAAAAGQVIATLHALRDPAAPAWPLLVGLRVEPGQGREISALRGAASLPPLLVERAALALARADVAADRDASDRAATIVEQIAAQAAGWSGAVLLARAGWHQAVRCDAGDAVAFAAALASLGLPAAAYNRHPMRSYCVVDLGLVLQLGREARPIGV